MTARLDQILRYHAMSKDQPARAHEKAKADVLAWLDKCIGPYDDLPTTRPENVSDEKWLAMLERVAIRNSLKLEIRKKMGL